ncbi:MAG: ABC transporter ATP-binding protein [Burkholderiales bacterium]|nr:ABC transporter ATP-binding protein [Burkholderiales bacterium]
MSEILLRAQGLGVTYASARGEVKALEGLDAVLHQGEFLSVLGPSGCGKSTLLKIAAGLLNPSAGRITLAGKPISGPRPDVGIVFQQPTLLPWQSTLDNVLLPIRTLRRDRVRGRARALELLQLVGLETFANHYPGELSGGMQQRVGIARGLVHDPTLLLMDEPFAALDAMTREHMMLELQRIWMAAGKSIVFITHSIPEAVFLSDRIVVLSARPGRTIRDLAIDLPRPRTVATMGEARFNAICNDLRSLFTELVHFD